MTQFSEGLIVISKFIGLGIVSEFDDGEAEGSEVYVEFFAEAQRRYYDLDGFAQPFHEEADLRVAECPTAGELRLGDIVYTPTNDAGKVIGVGPEGVYVSHYNGEIKKYSIRNWGAKPSHRIYR